MEVSGSTLGRAINIRDMRVRFLGIAKLNRAQFLEINHDRFRVNISHLIWRHIGLGEPASLLIMSDPPLDTQYLKRVIK